jgi:hypothetical protein
MMSRITLHLRKQARSRDADPTLSTFPGLTSIATASSAMWTRVRFTRSSAPSTSDAKVNVAVEETTVRYDDHGNVLDGEDRYPPIFVHTAKRGGAPEEWYEMQPPAPVRHDEWEEQTRNQALRIAV